MVKFNRRLDEALKKYKTPLCVGIDPHPDIMPDIFDNIEEFCMTVIEAAKNRVPAIKFQVALFESNGPEGMRILAKVSKIAQDSGLLVIMDAKRGDIPSSAKAYAEAWLGHAAPFPSDALTVNPYLGFDSLEPFFDQADKTGSGIFVLLGTSNPGSEDIQNLGKDPWYIRRYKPNPRGLTGTISGQKPLYIHLAEKLAPYVIKNSSIGIVIGANYSDEARVLRALLQKSPFLVPGYGHQGANIEDALSGLIKNGNMVIGGSFTNGVHYLPEFEQKKANKGEDDIFTGGLINASRSITHGRGVQDANNKQDALTAIIMAIDDTKEKIRNARCNSD